jgi:hypothetical protein
MIIFQSLSSSAFTWKDSTPLSLLLFVANFPTRNSLLRIIIIITHSLFYMQNSSNRTEAHFSPQMFGMVCKVNLPERVGDLETLILLTSCICHDLDHPGYNNIYQVGMGYAIYAIFSLN